MIEEQTHLFSDSSVALAARAYAAVMCCGGAITHSKSDASTFNVPSSEGVVSQLYLTDRSPKPFMMSLKNLKNSESSIRIQGIMQSMGLDGVYNKIVEGAPDKEIYAIMREHLENYMPKFNKLNMSDFMNKYFEPNMNAFADACKQANLPKVAEFVNALKNGFMVFQPAQSATEKSSDNKELVGA